MHTVTRQIGIDAGHRVTTHGSKCKNLHGHRYTIEATCVAKSELIETGEQQGMVLDFGFLKDEMMNVIDAPCDHGMMLWVADPWLYKIFLSDMSQLTAGGVEEYIQRNGQYVVTDSAMGKLCILKNIPTAENLAEHWFTRLAPRVNERSDGAAKLQSIRVHETPNCYADYIPGDA